LFIPTLPSFKIVILLVLLVLKVRELLVVTFIMELPPAKFNVGVDEVKTTLLLIDNLLSVY